MVILPPARTTIINKTIVYSDTVLPLKGIGKNLMVTSISGVNESSLEKCLNTIFESNQDVTFNTIQYSKENKKVYFYTDKKIDLEQYEESKFTHYQPLTSKKEILEEIKKGLTSPKIKSKDCISLFEISKYLRKMHQKYESIKKEYAQLCDDVLSLQYNNNCTFVIHDFDHQNNYISASFQRFSGRNFDSMYFAKQDEDLYLVKSEGIYGDDVFNLLSPFLSDLYDEFIKYSDYKNPEQDERFIESINSNFEVFITEYSTVIQTKEFVIYCFSVDNKYSLECNSNIVNEAIRGNENQLFKNIFVKIEDCPTWSQEELYQIRQKQLEEEQKIEDEITYNEVKKQKRLELTRKIFPFIKNKKN